MLCCYFYYFFNLPTCLLRIGVRFLPFWHRCIFNTYISTYRSDLFIGLRSIDIKQAVTGVGMKNNKFHPVTSRGTHTSNTFNDRKKSWSFLTFLSSPNFSHIRIPLDSNKIFVFLWVHLEIESDLTYKECPM